METNNTKSRTSPQDDSPELVLEPYTGQMLTASRAAHVTAVYERLIMNPQSSSIRVTRPLQPCGINPQDGSRAYRPRLYTQAELPKASDFFDI